MNSDDYHSGVTVGNLAVSVVNDEGAWRMVPEVFFETLTAGWPSGPLPTQFVMIGDGAYEGYYAVFTFHHQDGSDGTLEGFVIQGELPPVSGTTRAP